MDVTEISVMVHEKRSHPYEYGQYDCEVRLSAHLGPDENVDEAIMALRDRAAAQVQAHLDGWIDGIEVAHLRRVTLQKIDAALAYLPSRSRWGELDEAVAEIRAMIEDLPSCDEQDAAQFRLEEALAALQPQGDPGDADEADDHPEDPDIVHLDEVEPELR
jgi:hypothetical protein